MTTYSRLAVRVEIPEDYISLLEQAATAVGRRFARQHPFLDAEDIASEAKTRVLEDWDRIKGKIDNASNYGRSEYEVLRFFLTERAAKYCGKEKHEYIIRSSQVVYSTTEVRALLKEALFRPEMYKVPDLDEDYGTSVEAKSVWVNLQDLHEALSNVSNRTYNTLLAAFGPEDLGLPKPHYKAVSRAVEAVTRALNQRININSRQPHEGPGARKAIKNNYARYLTDTYEERPTYNLENIS